jgi:hypothetical protein
MTRLCEIQTHLSEDKEEQYLHYCMTEKKLIG